MSATARKTLASAIALSVVGAALFATQQLGAAKERARREEGTAAAETARSIVQEGVRGRLAAVESQAVAAASLPVLRAQIGVVDAATLRDGFRSESWWAPFRQEFPVQAVALSAPVPELLEGTKPEDLDGAAIGALVLAARQHQKSATLLRDADTVLLAGAAAIERPGGQSSVVILGRPLDAAFAEGLASSAHGAVAVADGKRTLLGAGLPEGQAALAGAVGSEKAGEWSDGKWSGAALPLAGGLSLWVGVKPRAVGGGLPFDLIAIWGAALCGAAVALALGLRGAPVESGPPLDEPEPPPPGSDPRLRSSGARRTSTGASDPRMGGAASDPRLRSSRISRTGTGSTGRTSGGTDSGAAGRRAPGRIDPTPDRPLQFGRYVLIDRLGEGGMAEVFRAVVFGAESFRRPFVVKLLRGDMVRSESLVRMFIDEAKLASGLIHSNIIPVFDFGKVDDEYFMAQEYILGRDLRRFTKKAMQADRKPLPQKEAVFIVREALRALEYAHGRTADNGKPLGIVHRDVSPNNILVSARGEVKLFDFGIAKVDEGRLTQTQTGVVKGNPSFMSPEQARGEPVDARSDLFSMGLVLYFLLTGEPLYEGDTAYKLLVQAAQGLTPETLAKVEKIAEPMRGILRLALEPDREQRFQTAVAFEHALSGLPCGTGAELAREMSRLCGDELKAEEAKFASVRPPDEEPFDASTLVQGPDGEPPDETFV